jgi:hypothetical protein
VQSNSEIDDPSRSKENYFEVRLIKKGKVENMSFVSGSIYLKKNEPEPIIIRINAKTPGVYTFSCMILARYEDTKEQIILIGENNEPFKFIFVK